MSKQRPINRWLYVFTEAPFASASGQEGLDAVLIGTSFEQHVDVLFIYDGVFLLKAGQQPSIPGLKNVTKSFTALADFGVEHCFVLTQSLLGRGLSVDDLSLKVEEVDALQVRDLMASYDRVLTF